MVKIASNMNLDRLKDVIAAIDIDNMQVGEEKELDESINSEIRDCPVTILNGEVKIGSDGATHSENLSEIAEEFNLESPDDVESIGFAHKVGNGVILENDSLSGMTQDEAVKLLKSKFDKVYVTDRLNGTVVKRLAKRQ